MSRSRRLPPLFEVMRETNPLSRSSGTLRSPEDAKPPAPPTVSSRIPDDVIAPRPRVLNGSQVLRPVQQPAEEVDAEEPSSEPSNVGRRLGQIVDLNRSYTISARWAFAAVGVLLAVILVVWAVAHRAGAGSERAKWVPQNPPPVAIAPSDAPAQLGGEPAGFNRPAPPTTPTPTPSTPPTSQSTRQQPTRAPGSGTGAAPAPGASPAGTVIVDSSSDPRQPGVNYLYVVTVGQQSDAVATAEFLSKNGFPAAAAGIGGSKVDSGGSGANNRPSKWRVFVLEGIPSGEYKHSARRAEIETKVKKLGEQWKKDPKGGFNFDSCGWDKFEAPASPKN